MDIAAVIGSVLIAAGIAGQAGYWIGRRRPESQAVVAREDGTAPPSAEGSGEAAAVIAAARRFRDASADIEVTLEEDDDPRLFEEFAARWRDLDDALAALDGTARMTGEEPDFT